MQFVCVCVDNFSTRIMPESCLMYAKSESDDGECHNQRVRWQVTVNSINGQPVSDNSFVFAMVAGVSVFAAAILYTIRRHKERQALLANTAQV